MLLAFSDQQLISALGFDFRETAEQNASSYNKAESTTSLKVASGGRGHILLFSNFQNTGGGVVY